MGEDNTFIIAGPPPLQPIPDTSLGKLIYEKLMESLDKSDALVSTYIVSWYRIWEHFLTVSNTNFKDH
jgi:hypothetical protein